MSNTSEHIPFESVAPIILQNNTYPDYPFVRFSGTGFFLQFLPYEEIYFVTARHCMLDDDGKVSERIRVQYENDEEIVFSEYLTTSYIDNEDEIEDVFVFVVKELDSDKIESLKERSLKLNHQDNIQFIINNIINTKENIRTVGFPSVSKEINEMNDSKQIAVTQPRGFYGKIINDTNIRNRYKINQISWKEGGLGGFSGSPILSLYPDEKGKVIPVVLGVLLTGSSSAAQFISINVVTDLIASYIKKNKLTKKSS